MKIRTRIFLVFILVVAAGFYFLVQWIGDDLRPRYLESVEEPLVDMANIFAELLADDFRDGKFASERWNTIFERIYERRFKARIYALEKRDVDLRVYVTDRAGQVLFDSSGRDVGADYSDWNDVHRTLRGEYGARASNEDPVNPVSVVLYIAAPILVDGEIAGVVSVGKPAHNADRFLEVAKYKLSVAGIIAAAVVLALGFGLYLWVSRPLEKLIRYARAVKEGKRTALPVLGRNEIGMMGEAMEEMRQELAGRDYAQRYVQTLTHELKSPLAAIRGAAELLDEDMPAADRARFIGNIRNQTERVHDLVGRMLELAALENRQVLDKVERIGLHELVREGIAALEPLAVQSGVAFKDNVDKRINIRGEPFLLRQAFVNLLRNALAFSPPAGEIRISTRLQGAQVELSIADQGPGIPEYALDKVFDRFFSLPRARRDEAGSETAWAGRDTVKGTGLGLSFVKEVAELHGGSVQLNNGASGGAVAVLRLPVQPH